MKRFELPVYLVVIAVLAAGLIGEARANARLTSDLALAPRDLYAQLSRSQVRLQLVDLREDPLDYEDEHLPGAIPLPGCDDGQAPAQARGRVMSSVPTVLITADGDRAAFERCRARFSAARNLEGGMDGWVTANLPSDSGEYVAPKLKAGGGCL